MCIGLLLEEGADRLQCQRTSLIQVTRNSEKKENLCYCGVDKRSTLQEGSGPQDRREGSNWSLLTRNTHQKGVSFAADSHKCPSLFKLES